MTAKEFGAHLRELRKARGLTLRELAQLVGVDFSYLSKIESGAVPPPSEKVISRIAVALKTTENELINLAGRIPPDVARTVQNSKTAQRLVRVSNKFREVAQMTTQGLRGLRSSAMVKVAISLFLVVAVSVSLWFASPVSALNIAITTPTSGTIGSSYSFTVDININTSELVPVSDVTVYIYRSGTRSSYQATLAALPLNTGSKTYTNTETGSAGPATVTATANSGWSWAYGYRSATFEGAPSAWGYGYGYGGLSSISYAISWTPPVGWPAGTYLVETQITASSTQFVKTGSSINMTTGGGGGGPTTPTPGTTSVTNVVDTNGKFTQSVTAQSADEKVNITINKDTVGKTSAGAPLSSITVQPMTATPDPPAQANVIGLAYNLGPEGATFSPPITVTFQYDPNDLPAGVDESNLVLAFYDETTGTWITLTDILVDTATNTISGKTSHFTVFSVIAYTRPAAFAVSGLTITPQEVNPGESMSISVAVQNTGDLEGTYNAVLKIDNAVVTTKTVTVAGKHTETVTFSVTAGAAGTYAVDVNGLAGTFTVKATAPPTTPPPTTPPPTTPPPTTPPPTTPPPTTPPPTTPPPTTPVPPPPGISGWLLTVIIILAVVIIGLAVWFIISRRRGTEHHLKT